MPIGAAIGGIASGLSAKSIADDLAKTALKAGKLKARSAIKAGSIAAKASIKGANTQVTAGEEANRLLLDWGNRATGTQRSYYDEATGYLAPYRQVGQGAVYSLADLYGLPTQANPRGGQPLSDDAIAAFERSPDYQFARTEGIKARDASAAARGMLLSGGAQKELTEFASGLASTNFGNYFNRLLQLSQLGENAAGSSANAALTTGTNISGIQTGIGSGLAAGRAGIGDAQARGIIGAGNARAGGVRDAGNAIYDAMIGAANSQASGQTSFINNISGGIGDAFRNWNLNSALRSGSTPTI